MNAPALPGIYGISNRHGWIFIGATGNIQGSLMNHLLGDDRIREKAPAGFMFEVCYAEKQKSRCERLIREYVPVYNELPG